MLIFSVALIDIFIAFVADTSLKQLVLSCFNY